MTTDTTLRIERIIDAPVEAVFSAWTTPSAMTEWYRDRPDDEVRVTTFDLRPGGEYRVEFGPPGATPYVEHGTYREVEAPSRLAYTETLTAPDGVLWASTAVTVTFEEEDSKTRLTLVHERFPSKEVRDDAARGWLPFLDRVEAVAKGAAQPT
jgi:uncharacterized protein YndB with AHSA1/START domain